MKTVLVVCVENPTRSQMEEGFHISKRHSK